MFEVLKYEIYFQQSSFQLNAFIFFCLNLITVKNECRACMLSSGNFMDIMKARQAGYFCI